MKTEQPPTIKKNKIYQSPTVKIQQLPKSFSSSKSILQEQKDRFLMHGKTPVFAMHGDTSTIDELASKISGQIRFELFGEAQHILHSVKQQYGVGENYLEHIYGPRIDQDEANQILFDYIKENSLQESLSVYWSNDLNCSARLVWKGYSFKCNRPEMRRYSLWLNGTSENPYLRRHGLRCLLDHEIGTHFYRNFNDGLQPWFSDRRKFGLRSAGSFESLCTEEGLAAVNTTLRAKEKYLWLSALVYYTACKSTEMTFKQLFDHLGQFLDSPEQRWKHVMRVKRGLVDPNDLGGYGKDQCYFEGAVAILRNLDSINFQLLMSGKICYDEVDRIKRLARTGSIVLPFIMRNMNDYRKQLKRMAMVNGLHIPRPQYMPPRDYVQRLKEREAGIVERRKVRKRKKHRASLPLFNQSSSTGSHTPSSQLADANSFEFKADAMNDLEDEGQSQRLFETTESFTSLLDTSVKGKHSRVMRKGSSSPCLKNLEQLPPPGESYPLFHSAVSKVSKDQEGDTSTTNKSTSSTFPSTSRCDQISRGCADIQNANQLKCYLVPFEYARPKTADQVEVGFTHMSVLQTLGTKGKLEITRAESVKTTEKDADCSMDMQCDGSLCMSSFRTKRLWGSPRSSDVRSWLLTLSATPSEQVLYASDTS